DYSSVAFDFAYLKKPLIYYHTESFTKFHYDKGYFDYDTMGFGQIIKSEGDLVEKIISYIDNGCVMEDKYQKRVDEFFKFRDANNSKRIYDWLIYK
ncbi:MAG: CDP-glycerol glycerophosphotransferase family protein, partial [Methanobrevibacter sp.]|nr:CDP-glycerol glycerophosphotransferase family protein [Methanobrevibacter sp.]